MNKQHQLEPLSRLPGLQQWCDEERFVVEDVGAHEAAVTDCNGGSVWSLFRVEEWLQIKGVILEEVNADLALCLSLARLHSRLLGCRYGVDGGGLWLHADLFPHDQTGSAVGAAILHMQSIVDSTYDLLMRIQQSGIEADDTAIDEAFGLNGDARLH